MARRQSARSVNVLVTATLSLTSNSAQYLLSSAAGAAFKGAVPGIVSRYRAALAIREDETVSSMSKNYVEENFAEEVRENGSDFSKELAIAFAKRVLSSPLIKGVSLYELSQFADDGDSPEELDGIFAKMTTAQIAKDWPEIHELQEAVIADYEKDVAKQAARKSKDEAKRMKDAAMSTGNMIETLRRAGYAVTKMAPVKATSKKAVAKKSK